MEEIVFWSNAAASPEALIAADGVYEVNELHEGAVRAGEVRQGNQGGR